MVLVYVGISGEIHAGDAVFSSALFALVMGVVTLHELGHALAAKLLGIRVKRISITGIGGLAEVSDFLDSRRELLVTLAGPFVNVLVAIVIWPAAQSAGTESLLGELWMLNLVVLLFNLIPLYPMDGGRIFRVLLGLIFGERVSYTFCKYINLLLLGAAVVVCLQTEAFVMLVILGFMGLYGVGACRAMEETVLLQVRGESELSDMFNKLLKSHCAFSLCGQMKANEVEFDYSLSSDSAGAELVLQSRPSDPCHPPVICTFAAGSEPVWTPKYVVYIHYQRAALMVLRDTLFSCNRALTVSA